MVRLKEYSRKRPKEAVFTFQFHYGTIKRGSSPYWITVYAKFQFHYGTIKRKDNLFGYSRGKYFNSTMVRLKASRTYDYAATLINFNSTMVRLKEKLPRLPLVILVHFNSTMVRLKDNLSYLGIMRKSISIPLWYD